MGIVNDPAICATKGKSEGAVHPSRFKPDWEIASGGAQVYAGDHAGNKKWGEIVPIAM